MAGHSTARRRPWRHLVPLRLRRHWKALAGAALVVLLLAVVLGGMRVRPYVSSELVAEDTVTQNIEGEGDLFDDGEHEIEITFNEDEYAEMLRVFREEGEKEFIRADIVIDGTVLNDVGLRLKGNSTLMSLRSDGDGAAGEGGGFGAGGPGGTTLSDEEPENLPWLISFDEYQSGRAFQGRTEIALRPGTATSDTALNEALALSLTAADGQATQDFTFTSVAVNGGDSVPRLLLESPDEPWAAELGDGVLYKARAGGSLDYLGDDPTDYEEAFRQVNAEGSYDLTPVMRLLQFVADADDEEFATELENHLDVDSFARYLATQALISNGDAMDGPGNNYYLWYDTDNERFTVLSWDLNLALGSMGTPGGGEDTDPPEGMDPPDDMELPEGMELPDGMELPEGFEPPEGMVPPGDRELPEGMELPEEGAGGGRGSGALKERFLADDTFQELYERAYAELREELIDDGVALDLLDSLTEQAGNAGDDGAAEAGEQLATQLSTISETPQESSMFGGGGGGGRGGQGRTRPAA
ncbi:CotH kinase family protein [Streptomyces sp. NBRC 109706]|uniref:CotH kinase family protein n=1 Tax=Streptomyces sp. NBRC 109706 TaxID=1550035 RepID=UPI00099D46B8|nr:CotH kinase family protein [Streptomyces sp. NBRC 109706]